MNSEVQSPVIYICSTAIFDFSTNKKIECNCNPSDIRTSLVSNQQYNRLKDISSNIQKTVDQINAKNNKKTFRKRNLRFKSQKNLKCKPKNAVLNLEEQPITRSISSHLQEVNTTRRRYKISGGSPLKWMWDKNEFHRPLTKEDSLRYQYGISKN